MLKGINVTHILHLDKIYKSPPSHTTAMEKTENPDWVITILKLKKEAEENKKKSKEGRSNDDN